MGNVLILQIGHPEFDPQDSQWKRESFQKDILQLYMHTMAHAHYGTCTPWHMHTMATIPTHAFCTP